ncbi:inositol monophosphatase family protein [Nakamurella lactea]|uniref:inositol monophosphatase family protein n=1 Tax=Nakamurella lactea TaxID=459515 RepID=UPI0003F79B18|nr:inositol monophosphatase [Nakamurella lactea]
MTTNEPNRLSAEEAGLPAEAEGLAIELACAAARRIAVTPAEAIRTKRHDADIVTDLDTSIESEVRDALLAAFPDHRLVGEEFGAAGDAAADFTWYCDPVDGTTNYANDLGWSSFSLCCNDSAGAVLGVVAHPVRRELVVARRGGGALRYLLDEQFAPSGEPQPLQVSTTNTLAGTVFTTELLAHQPWPGLYPMMDSLAQRFCTTRILGSSALTLLQVATGRAAGAVIARFSPIDNQASMLATVEAGGVCLDETGNSTVGPAAGGVLVAAPGVADQLSGLWRRAIPD